MRTGLYLDRHMAEAAQAAEPALVGRRRQRMIGYDRDHRGAMAGPDLPQMEVGDAVALGLDAVADDSFEILVRVDVEQYGAGSRSNP